MLVGRATFRSAGQRTVHPGHTAERESRGSGSDTGRRQGLSLVELRIRPFSLLTDLPASTRLCRKAADRPFLPERQRTNLRNPYEVFKSIRLKVRRKLP